MARPAHPRDHDPTVRERLDQAIEGEVLLPIADKATAALVRSRIYYLIRAYKYYDPAKHALVKQIRTKLLDSIKVRAIRPHYHYDEAAFPYCLVLDCRDEAASAMENAITDIPSSIPMTGRPQLARRDELDDEPDLLPPDAEDDYTRISNQYKLRGS